MSYQRIIDFYIPLEYASVCWNPSQKINRSIEIVQNKAAKFVTNCYPKKGKEDEFSVTRLIKQLGWDSLEERRSKARLSMIYKIINNHQSTPTLCPNQIGQQERAMKGRLVHRISCWNQKLNLSTLATHSSTRGHNYGTLLCHLNRPMHPTLKLSNSTLKINL